MYTQVKKVVSGDLCSADAPSSQPDGDVFDDVSVDQSVPAFTNLTNYKVCYDGVGKHSDAVARLSEEFSAAREFKIAKCIQL